MNQIYVAKQVNRVLQMVAQSLNLPEANAMEIADLYEEYAIGRTYPAGFIFKWGVNDDGETQLYSVLQEHTSQEDWKPEESPALYKKIGFTDKGVPIWTQPLGRDDAYMLNDPVEHSGKFWRSTIDYNVWEPGTVGTETIWVQYTQETEDD